MQSEKEYILESFQKNFQHLANKPIAIYGIGKNTKIILENFDTENIVCLMDAAREGDVIYGKPVLCADEALRLGVSTIIIVARANNTRIIYRRIADFCRQNEIKVYDINGIEIVDRKDDAKSFERYSEIRRDILKDKIQNADVVSFDVFDTLIMRRCLYPRDIFLMIGEDFAKERIRAETDLYAEGKHPNICEIYERMDSRYSMQKEIDMEAEYLVFRKAMLGILNFAMEQGKTVFLTSDMYLPKEMIASLLCKMGLQFSPEHILVSCDFGLSKHSGLYRVLCERANSPPQKILHIGDNAQADIECAQRHHIETFYAPSALAMLEDSYCDALLQYDGALANRLLIGEFIASALNNPFLFAEHDGKFKIDSNYEMAYSFIAPMIYCFFGWLVRTSEDLGLDLILLSARDGYIIEKLYDLMCDKDSCVLPPMKYFYISRAVAVLAGIIDEDDIVHAAELAYAGSAEEMLQSRMRLTSGELLRRKDGESDKGYILRHKDIIFRNAKRLREKYLKYIGRLGIKASDKVGFFDFVSSGTCQKALTNIVSFDLTGLYFAGISYESDYKKSAKIEAMYGILNVFQKTYNILENFFFMENVCTSYETTLADFDDNGAPQFLPEYRSEAQLDVLREIQTAVCDYCVHSQLNVSDLSSADKHVADIIFGLLRDSYSVINTGYFDNELLHDEFCNRKFILS